MQPHASGAVLCSVETGRHNARTLARRRARRGTELDVETVGGVLPLKFNPLQPTVFHEPWYLKAVTGGAFQEVSVSAGGRVVGRFPFVLSRMPGGHALCSMPELTHFLGPAIDAGKGSAANRALKQDGILRDLLDQMPRATGFYHKMHGATTDTLVFQERGYRTAVQFTYEIAPAPADDIWKAMRDKTRNVIRRAQAQYRVADLADPASFAALYNDNLHDRGVQNHYARIKPLCEALLFHEQGRILTAVNAVGKICAAILYVWDARAAYYLLTTRTEEAGNGAVSLLIWHAIQDAAGRGLIFDFDGVATPGSRVFYIGFGGRVVPRYIVSRYTIGHRISGRLANPFRRPTKETYQW
jgi:hypothetical protein